MNGRKNQVKPGIGGRVVAERLKREWSQAELADRVGLTRSSMNQKERGERPFKLEEICQIADAFGISVEELIRGVKPEHVTVHQDLGLTEDCYEALRNFREVHPELTAALSRVLASGDILRLLAQCVDCPPVLTASGEFLGIETTSDAKGMVRCSMSPNIYREVLGLSLLSALRDCAADAWYGRKK